MESKLVPILQTAPIQFSVVTTLDCKDWKTVIKDSPLGDHPLVNHPYYFCYQAFCAITYRKIHDMGIVGDQVDFVFDYKDAISDRANELFGQVRDELNKLPYVCGMIGMAQPGDDKKLPPPFKGLTYYRHACYIIQDIRTAKGE